MSRKPLDFDLDKLENDESAEGPPEEAKIETSITGIEHVTITGDHALIETDIAQDITLTGEQVHVEERVPPAATPEASETPAPQDLESAEEPDAAQSKK